MHKLLLPLLLLFTLTASSQIYISLAPALTNTAGPLSEKANVAIEAGKQWGVFSAGLALGKTTLSRMHGIDTSTYLELRPNLNIFQQGRFTNTLTVGVGYIFHGEENFLTELSSGIEYSATESFHINGVFGQYYYSGLYSTSNTTFFGFSFVWYLKPSKERQRKASVGAINHELLKL